MRMQKATLDWGKPGTARYRRKCQLKGISQKDIGKRCKPPISQPGINQFENALTSLTHSKAERLAPGYFPELWRGNHRAEAVNSVWMLWFATVEESNNEALKERVAELKCNWTEYPWEKPEQGLFAGLSAAETEVGRLAVVR